MWKKAQGKMWSKLVWSSHMDFTLSNGKYDHWETAKGATSDCNGHHNGWIDPLMKERLGLMKAMDWKSVSQW